MRLAVSLDHFVVILTKILPVSVNFFNHISVVHKLVFQSAIPFGSNTGCDSEKHPPPQSLDQLKDSFGLSQPPATASSNQFVPQNNFLQSSLYPFPPGPQINPVQQFPQNAPFPLAATVSQLAQTMPTFPPGTVPTFPPPFPFPSPFFSGTQQQVNIFGLFNTPTLLRLGHDLSNYFLF